MESKPIKELCAYENEWSIKVKVVRKSTIESYDNHAGILLIMKLILIDKEGSKIQAVLFNDAINKFDGVIEKGKSYLIRNGNVRPVNRKYQNVNDEVELTLTKATEVEEIKEHIFDAISASFVQFNELPNFVGKDVMIDIIGLVVMVKPSFVINIKRPSGRTTKKREIILLDIRYNTLKFYLWGDLVDNEGKVLEDKVHERPTVAAFNVKANYYEGELNISTSSVSLIEIDPQIEESTTIKNSTQHLWQDGGIYNLLGPTKRMNDAAIVDLNDIIGNIVTETYCAFIGRIVKVQNKDNPWYEVCNGCNFRVYPEGDKKIVTCIGCKAEEMPFTRKYLLKLIVSACNQEVYTTIFDGAESFIECTVTQYAETLLKSNKKELFEYYKKLTLSEDKEFKFLVKMDVKKREDRSRKKLIVE